jgi:hypothetical protein
MATTAEELVPQHSCKWLQREKRKPQAHLLSEIGADEMPFFSDRSAPGVVSSNKRSDGTADVLER